MPPTRPRSRRSRSHSRHRGRKSSPKVTRRNRSSERSFRGTESIFHSGEGLKDDDEWEIKLFDKDKALQSVFPFKNKQEFISLTERIWITKNKLEMYIFENKETRRNYTYAYKIELDTSKFQGGYYQDVLRYTGQSSDSTPFNYMQIDNQKASVLLKSPLPEHTDAPAIAPVHAPGHAPKRSGFFLWSKKQRGHPISTPSR